MTETAIRRRALTTVVAFGVVSLLADIVYEGARSIIGPYLLTLGASASVVGLLSGAGEFTGYALRVVTGRVADRTGGYWLMTITGYTLTVVAVPLLGLVGRVDLALALVVAERLGKAVRSPARDALLSEASAPIGRGWGFGLHEALDQTGAVVGPLLLAGVLSLRDGSYELAFAVLAVPGILVLATLAVARRMMPASALTPAGTDATSGADSKDLARTRKPYLTFVFTSALGFAPFPLIAFHIAERSIASDAQIPLMFAAAMAVDALVALVSGRFYDRRGLRVLLVLPLLSVTALVAFTPTLWMVWAGALAWGAVVGIQESTLRAAVGDLTPPERRATEYGVFNMAYGTALLASGGVLGWLYEWSIPVMAAFVAGTQSVAFIVIRRLSQRIPAIPPGTEA